MSLKPIPVNVDDPANVAQVLLDYVNRGNSATELAEYIRRGHRTLQQSIMRAILELLRHWAADHVNGRYDLRNEATVELAVRLTKATEGQGYLPFI